MFTSSRPHCLITDFDCFMEMLTALRMADHARRQGHTRAANNFQAQALALAEAMSGEGR